MEQVNEKIAIVGARACSTYGRIQAFRYAKVLSSAGVQIISGMAYGIDAEAHKGALEGGTATYAEFELLNKKTHRRYSDKLGISVLDLTQIDMASDEDKAFGIDTWAAVFKAKTWEELRMAVQSNEYMKDAAETLYELNSDETIRQQCEARRRAEIEEKHMQDKLKKLEEDKENLTKEKTELHIKLQNEISETEKWKAKYEQLLATQTEKKN